LTLDTVADESVPAGTLERPGRVVTVGVGRAVVAAGQTLVDVDADAVVFGVDEAGLGVNVVKLFKGYLHRRSLLQWPVL
jgi:hypothetical protein